MISKYRTIGFIELGCALLLSALFVYLFIQRGDQPSDTYAILVMFLYLAAWTMWMVASYTLAKAKGYTTEMARGIFVFLILLAFCLPVAAFVYPAVVIFGLEDRAKRRRW